MPLSNEFWQDEEDELWAALVALYLMTLIQGVDGGTSILPPELQALVDVDKINAQTLTQSAQFRRALMDGIESTTREQVDKVITEWEQTGNGDIGVLSVMLAPIFSESRAEMIAITEVTRAFQEGNILAWSTLGLYASFMQWNTQKDERVCPICAPRDGRIMPLTSNDKPPAHPRCRCWTSPVVRLP